MKERNSANVSKSHLLQMRGLKQSIVSALGHRLESHLLQMRGLKLQLFFNLKHLSKSHLLQMRGLKHQYNQLYKYGEEVASFTDAWIETVELMDVKREDDGRIFYRCVD